MGNYIGSKAGSKANGGGGGGGGGGCSGRSKSGGNAKPVARPSGSKQPGQATGVIFDWVSQSHGRIVIRPSSSKTGHGG